MTMTMSKDACSLVRTLAEKAALPEHGGLRIVLNPDTNSLSMGLAHRHERSDIVVAGDGALLFLSPAAADRTQDMTLCAEITDARSAFFLQAA